MHSPYSLSLLSIRQIPFYRLHFRSTSELPEADSVPAIQRRIPGFRLHPCCFEYSLFLRSHSTSFIASVEYLGAFGDDHKKRYFDFHASVFVGEGENSVDGILLRTDVERFPATLYHILLHELAHIFCTRNELGGDNFYKRYCMDNTLSSEEDGAINAGYAVWRELIAELIASEKDDNCVFLSLGDKEDILRYYMEEIEDGDRKLAVSMLLCEALTSREGEPAATWGDTKKKIEKYKPFDEPLFMDLLELVVRKLKKNFVEIDRDFILELGSLYLFLVTQSDVKKLQKRLSEEH